MLLIQYAGYFAVRLVLITLLTKKLPVAAAAASTRMTYVARRIHCTLPLRLHTSVMLGISHSRTDPYSQVAAEKHLEPETAAEEQRARAEAADPNPQSKTLEEYEKEGHKI